MIVYKKEDSITVDEFKSILQRSTLAERRPVNEPHRLAKMIEHGNLIVTARDGQKLIGVARSLSDFLYCTYLSDLAVDSDYQHQGIGKELIRQTKLLAPEATLILLAAPKAVDYYPKIGMTKWDHAFMLKNIADLK